LKELDFKPTFVNIHTIKPIDRELISELAKTHDAIVTVEEHQIIGGLGSAVAEVMAETGAPCKLYRLGILDIFGQSGKPDELYDLYDISPRAIKEAVIKAAE
jgi:transketolase